MIFSNIINRANSEKDEILYKLIKKLFMKYSCKDLHLYGRFQVAKLETLIYNSKINNIKNSPIWDKVSGGIIPSFNSGISILKLDKFTYMIFNYVILSEKTTSDFMPEELHVYIVGKNKDRYYESINRCASNRMSPSYRLYINYLGGGRMSTALEPVLYNDIISKNKDTIFNYIVEWKRSKSLYKKYNILYKTGILLYGPPGTGKSSIAKAIASMNEVNKKNLFILDLTKPLRELENCHVMYNSVILMEDIDCVLKKRNGDKDMTAEEKAKLNFVLGLLDGVHGDCNGNIFILTTNHIEDLDEALIRDGRINLKVHMDNFDQAEAIYMCNRYNISADIILKGETYPINPSYLQNKIIQHKLKHVGLIK